MIRERFLEEAVSVLAVGKPGITEKQTWTEHVRGELHSVPFFATCWRTQAQKRYLVLHQVAETMRKG